MSKPVPDLLKRTFYFGCWGRVGHSLHTPDGKSLSYSHRLPPDQTPWDDVLDGGLPPRPGRHMEAPNGHAALHHKDGWTALAFWDNSVDTRGGSHSTFLFEGIYDFDAALALARQQFPTIFARYPFEVVPHVEKGRRAA